MRAVSLVILTVAFHVYNVDGNVIAESRERVGNSTDFEIPVAPPLAMRTELVATPARTTLRTPSMVGRNSDLTVGTILEPRWTNLPMMVGVPVFRTRVFLAQTIPPIDDLPIMAGFPIFATRLHTPSPRPAPEGTLKGDSVKSTARTTTTVKDKSGIMAVTDISPTTLMIPTTTIKRTTEPTMKTFMTTTTQPRTEPMVIGFPVFRTRFLIPSTPPEHLPTTDVLTPIGNKRSWEYTTTAVVDTSAVTTKLIHRTVRTTGTTKQVTSLPTTSIVVASNSSTPRSAATNSSISITTLEAGDGRLPVFRNRSVNIINHTTGHIVIVGLCGYPPYNDRLACLRLNYLSDPLSECEEEWGRILFAILVGIAAAAIIGVNGLIIVIVLRDPDMRTHYDSIKVSLAIADAIIGFLLLIAVLPNLIWIRGLSEKDVVDAIVNDVNSPGAIVVGSLLSVTMQASMLHLCFLSIERFLSIRISFWLLRRKRSSVTITLATIWMVSIVAAFLPAASPQSFEYKFQPALLIHMLTLKPKDGTNTAVGNEGLIYMMISLVLPYVVMVAFCISTGVVSYKKLKSSKKYFGKERSASSNDSHLKSVSGPFSPVREKAKRNLKPEISVFVTILLMIGAFTFTLLPFAVVLALFVMGVLNCDNYTIPYVVAFYFGLLNSLANGIIYSVRDPRFRSSVKSVITCEDIRNIKKKFLGNSSHSSRV